MKPFFLLLLLIGSGILFATLCRPVELLTAALRSLGHWPARLMAKRHLASAALQAATARQRPLSGDGWRPAAQF